MPRPKRTLSVTSSYNVSSWFAESCASDVGSEYIGKHARKKRRRRQRRRETLDATQYEPVVSDPRVAGIPMVTDSCLETLLDATQVIDGGQHGTEPQSKTEVVPTRSLHPHATDRLTTTVTSGRKPTIATTSFLTTRTVARHAPRKNNTLNNNSNNVGVVHPDALRPFPCALKPFRRMNAFIYTDLDETDVHPEALRPFPFALKPLRRMNAIIYTDLDETE